MLATIKLNGILNARQTLTIQQRQSIKWKKILFAVSILSTVGLLFFFAKHRFYCHDLGKKHTYTYHLMCNMSILCMNYSFQLVCILRVFDRHCQYAVSFHHYLGLSIAIHADCAGTARKSNAVFERQAEDKLRN